MARGRVGTHQHLCHSDLHLQAFLSQRDELAPALLLQMQELRLEEEMSLPEVTREEPELEHRSPGFCPEMKSPESPSTPPSRKLWSLQFHFEIMTSFKEKKE